MHLALSISFLSATANGFAQTTSHDDPNAQTIVQADANGILHFRARAIPLPKSISPEARAFLRAAYQQTGPGFDRPLPADTDTAGWKKLIADTDSAYASMMDDMVKAASARVEKANVAGVTVYVGRANTIPPSRARRAVLYIHGGGFVMFPDGKYAAALAASYATLCACTVFSVNYRTPPDYPFPIPLQDVMLVYRDLLKDYKNEDLAVAGESAGGNLVAAMILRARNEKLPLPSMALLLSPLVDLTYTGDSAQTNLGLDAALRRTFQSTVYTGRHDLKDPYLSPLFGDFKPGFPPTYIQSGTRDLLLSDAVRLHRALRRAGQESELHIWEGMSHAEFGDKAPEAAEMVSEQKHFLAKRWGAVDN
jgi:acetyl esterase/lipase